MKNKRIKLLLTLLAAFVVVLSVTGIALAYNPPDVAPQVHYTFNQNYGAGGIVLQGTATAGTDVAAPSPAIIRNGYDLNSWYTNAACTGTAAIAAPTGSATINQDTNFYAKWVAHPVTVTFNSQSGTYVPSYHGLYGGLVVQPTDPSKAGYTFAGWYTDAVTQDATTQWNFATSTLTTTAALAGTQPLYAKWTGSGPGASQALVNFMWNGTDGTAMYSQVAVQASGLVSAPATAPTRAGYTFTGWYTTSGATTPWNFATMHAGAALSTTSIYAGWTAINYTVTYNVNGGTAVAAWTPVTYAGDAPVTLNGHLPTAASVAPKKAGYTLGGWYYDAALTLPATTADTVTGNITLYAKWLANYTVTFHKNDGSASDVLGQVATFAGQTLDPAAPPAITARPGYNPDGKWYTDAACTTEFTFGATGTVVTSNLNLYVKWIPGTGKTVTFDSQGGSAVAAQGVAANGPQTVTKPANPTRNGYAFRCWTTNLATNPIVAFAFAGETGAIAIPGDTTLYAVWDKVGAYRVTYEVDGAVYNATDYTWGATFAIPANPTKAGYTFNGWTYNAGTHLTYAGDTWGTTNPALYTNRTVNANWTLDAQFTVNTYTINFSTAYGVQPVAQTKQYGSLVDAPVAPTYAGKVLVGWFTGQNGTGTQWNFGTSTVAGGMTLYAYWVDQVTVTLDLNGSTSVLTNGQQPMFGVTGASPWAAGANQILANSKLNQPVYTTTGTPALTGYTFAGWYRDSPATGSQWVFGAAGTTVTGSVTLYAKFTKTVVFRPTNGTSTFSMTADSNTPTVTVTNPTLAGFTFLGWDGNGNGSLGDPGDVAATAGSTVVPVTGASPAAYAALWQIAGVGQFSVTYRNGYVAADGTPAYYNVLARQAVANGTVISSLPVVTRPGYTFAGWFIDASPYGVYDPAVEGTTPVTSLTVTSDVLLVPKWTAIDYTLTYDSQGGVAVAGGPVHYGDTLTAPVPAPTKAGFTFAGWYKEAACINQWNFGVDTITGNTTLYAKWLDDVTVNFMVGGVLETQTTIHNGQTVANHTPVAPTGYTFSGWYTAATGGSAFMLPLPADANSAPVTASITVYAQYTLNPALACVVTFSSQAGTSYTPSQTAAQGGKLTAPANPVLNGSTFTGWYTTNVPANQDATTQWNFATSVLPSSATYTLYAGWKADVTVSIYKLDGTTTSSVYAAQYGSTISTPVDPAFNGTIAWDGKWYTDQLCTTVWDSSKALTAAITLYPGRITKTAVTFTPNGGLPAPSVQYVTPGSKVTQPTITRDGYVVGGWYVMSGVGNSVMGPQWNFATDTVGAAPITLAVQWVKGYTVTYNVNYVGGKNLTATSLYNQTVTPIAEPTRAGYVLAGWYTDAALTNQWVFATDTLTKDTTLYAKWTAVTLTVKPYSLVRTKSNITVYATTNVGTLNAASHVFTANGSFTFAVKNSAGAVVALKTVKITNIDNDKPVITVKTAAGVTVANGATVTSSSLKVSVTDSDSVVTKTMKRNGVATAFKTTLTSKGLYVITAKDRVGNVSTFTVRLK